MKNPHGVEPTLYMKRKESEYAIRCDSDYGPIFGSYDGNIHITQDCNKKNCCYVVNDGIREYECHPEYRSSLFVNTAGPDEENRFSILDYEVYSHN